LKLRWHARERATQLVQVGLEGARAIRRLAQRIGGNHPSGAADPRLADAWKIDLTEERAPQRRAMTLGQIVAERSLPNEGVDVQVDHFARSIEFDGGERNVELARPIRRRFHKPLGTFSRS